MHSPRRGLALLDAGTTASVVWLFRWDHLTAAGRTPALTRASRDQAVHLAPALDRGFHHQPALVVLLDHLACRPYRATGARQVVP